MQNASKPGRRLLAATLAAGWAAAAAAQPPPADGAVAATLRRAGITPTPATLGGTDQKSRDAAINRLARSYDLPPEILELRDRLPDNPAAVMDRLGLVRRDGAARTNLSDRTPPSAAEIFDALAPR